MHKGKLRGDDRRKQSPKQPRPQWWQLGFSALSFNSGQGWNAADSFESQHSHQGVLALRTGIVEMLALRTGIAETRYEM